MSDTYARYAAICTKFYELTTNSASTGEFVFQKSQASPGQRVLFVGGMFGVAAALLAKGLSVTVVDYTDEMVEIGKDRVPGATVSKADLRALPFESEFDLVLVVGRVFTHMLTDDDLSHAIKGCKRALRKGGALFADNYEDTRVQQTSYFNGQIEGKDHSSHIVRQSSTTRLSEKPFIVRWDAEYSGTVEDRTFSFRDSIEHRAFSRPEFTQYLEAAGLRTVAQGDNFDETSFYTLARREV
jgi:ubiquinone/menaquinone biosynthesis C-methylase UbiE